MDPPGGSGRRGDRLAIFRGGLPASRRLARRLPPAGHGGRRARRRLRPRGPGRRSVGILRRRAQPGLARYERVCQGRTGLWTGRAVRTPDLRRPLGGGGGPRGRLSRERRDRGPARRALASGPPRALLPGSALAGGPPPHDPRTPPAPPPPPPA